MEKIPTVTINYPISVTERLLLLDNTLQRHNEGKWNEHFNQELPGYSSFNDAGVECEVGEFLYAMARILKPEYVLETGTHVGIGASYLGLALKDNKKGHLDTIEFIPEHYLTASDRIKKIGLYEFVSLHLTDARIFEPKVKYDLIFLDTEPQTRFAELIRYYPYLNEGGFVFIHDTPRSLCQGNINPDHPNEVSWPFGNMPESIKNWVKEGNLKPFHFATARGLTGFYKKHKDDYGGW